MTDALRSPAGSRTIVVNSLFQLLPALAGVHDRAALSAVTDGRGKPVDYAIVVVVFSPTVCLHLGYVSLQLPTRHSDVVALKCFAFTPLAPQTADHTELVTT